MPVAMRNPIAPRIRIPIAETFATVLYSIEEGFFRTCQTRFDCMANDFSLLPRESLFSSIIMQDKLVL